MNYLIYLNKIFFISFKPINEPKPNKIEAETLSWITCAFLLLLIKEATLLEKTATEVSIGIAETTTIIPKINNWNDTEPIPGLTNWGKNAIKNSAVLGFVISIKTLS